MLASGEIPDLYGDDELETIMAGLRNEVKGLGLVESRENCWKFFIERVRRQLKVSFVWMHCIMLQLNATDGACRLDSGFQFGHKNEFQPTTLGLKTAHVP